MSDGTRTPTLLLPDAGPAGKGRVVQGLRAVARSRLGRGTLAVLLVVVGAAAALSEIRPWHHQYPAATVRADLGSADPATFVRGYLEALNNGDVTAAHAAETPYRRGLGDGPRYRDVSNIRIRGVDNDPEYAAQVHVSAAVDVFVSYRASYSRLPWSHTDESLSYAVVRDADGRWHVNDAGVP